MKRQLIELEKIFANLILDKGFGSRIHKELLKPNNKRKITQLKHVHGILIDVSPEKIYK